MVAEIYARTKRHRGRLARPEGIQPGSSDIHWRRRTRWCHSQGSRRSEPRACGRSVGQAANLCLGFTFICSKSRKGRFLIIRKIRRDRMMAKLLELKEEMRRRMHWPISEQGEWLKQVVGGFFNYHAVPTNSRALAAFRHHVRVLCSIIPSFFLCSFNRLECMADWSPPLLSPSRSTRQWSGRKYAHVMKHGCRAGK